MDTITRYITAHKNTIRSLQKESTPAQLINNNSLFEKLSDEGCENFFDYIEWLGLSNNQNLIVLPCSHHYYFDSEDLKDIELIVNLKLLNRVRKTKDFLHSLYGILPYGSCFVGCFFDHKYRRNFFPGSFKSQHSAKYHLELIDQGIESKVPLLNLIFNIMDQKTMRFMTKKSVILLLEESRFKVLDITEFKGLTYFYAQKNPSSSD